MSFELIIHKFRIVPEGRHDCNKTSTTFIKPRRGDILLIFNSLYIFNEEQ